MKPYFLKSVCCAAVLFAGAAHAQSENTGNIKLTGRIFSSTCEVSINGNSNGGNATVPMGNYSSEAFTKKGDVVGGNGRNGQIQFNLSGCPEDKSKVVLEVHADLFDAKMIKLDNSTSSSSAKNVGVYLYQAKDTANPMDLTKTHSYNIDKVSNTADIDLVAKYVSTENDVTAGTANASFDYTISYN